MNDHGLPVDHGLLYAHCVNTDYRLAAGLRLGIGHHVGVMDCFQSLMEIPLEEYHRWVSNLPEGAARRKMEGVLKFGEIEVNQGHAGEILPLLKESWTEPLAQCLQAMMKEPALYLMIRKLA